MPDTLETPGRKLDDARTKIDAAWEAILAIRERNIDVTEFRESIDRLDRVEAMPASIEGQIAMRERLD